MTGALTPAPVFSRRRAGVLLHPTALPGNDGKLGQQARSFIDYLADAGITVWQTLPTGPTHSDLSPYQSLSAHAGNPEFIDLSELVYLDLLSTDELAREARARALEIAAGRFLAATGPTSVTANQDTWRQFLSDHKAWLDDFALFIAIRDAHGGIPWHEWPMPLRRREPWALEEFRARHCNAIEQVCFEQFIGHLQWQAMRRYARERGVLLFGDIPIFVAHDSADVWAHPDMFKLDAQGQPLVVAGVPPDYFSPDGQHWGNPLYDWQAMAGDGYRWWIDRLASQQEKFDLLRIDHFRGLQAFWEIPAADARPVNGHWVAGPADAFLSACFEQLPELPLVAENLGIIGADVEALRQRFNLPGMTVMQFGFDGSASNPHLLHNHKEHDLVYTGTHDNDTTLGWYQSLDERTRDHVNQYLRLTDDNVPRQIIQAALGSVSGLVMIPMQDLLGLDSSARFNTPGTTSNNWIWQLPENYQSLARSDSLRSMVNIYGR
ncbi:MULTISPECIES: 4-alpha-glucanotransferase [unclassified Marinobacter]|uniref:4-alpha-glucanotransferase n=1 Tax=unclassified Marinobacter TaxID=83889 RepID=UPI00126946F7|nr:MULTISPECIES: 4-alpha-glucanotransferase [unclassified Marinobacter]QFS87122.1 4-alpha-glucanotransferase [Marinobacter sp. THAF197a]QFT50906.1 4-alpha-glucanotransferase [Marinobacter sp. THAF39]